jgi:hypothetical protein
VNTSGNSLLVRADFVLDRSRGGDQLTFKRWRRGLAEAIPGLMGFPDIRAKVRLHHGEEQGRYSVWLRLPARRLPNRKGLGKVRVRLRERLDSALLAVSGDVIKFGVRRCKARHQLRLISPEPCPMRLVPVGPELVSV